MIAILWLILFGIFTGAYIAYFGYLKLNAEKEWGLKIDPYLSPSVTILVSAHNEEEVIQAKLENLAEVSYPKEKLEIILIDDASTDQTLAKVYEFLEKHPELSVKVLRQNPRRGKAEALNLALETSSNDIVVITDADSIWPQDILRKALPYMSDPTVGAITGRSVPSNLDVSWLTKTEKKYMDFMNTVRLGESKLHSTIRFEGCFCAFKRNAFDKFDSESGADDSGTALRVVQNGFRTILIPEVFAFSEVPYKFRRRMKTKVRRAIHLNGLWLLCLKLFFGKRLRLPKRIALLEIFISILNPIVFVALVFSTFALFAFYPIFFLPLIVIFCLLSLKPNLRNYIINGVFDQFILFYATFFHTGKKRIRAWDS